MIGDGQHEANHNWLVLFVILEVSNALVQFLPLLLGKQQVLVLELPGHRKELKLIVVSEHIEVLEVLKT